jgi:hypothetical protein
MDRVGQQSISTTTRDGQKRVPKRDSFTLPTLLKGHTEEMYKEQRERVLLDADRSVTDRNANWDDTHVTSQGAAAGARRGKEDHR